MILQGQLEDRLIRRNLSIGCVLIPLKWASSQLQNRVRLDPDRYKRLIAYGARFAPRRKNREIFVAALDAYLEKVE